MTEVSQQPRSLDADAIAAVEALRGSYRPDRITTLFVGESAPVNGTFFYDGNNSMVRYMRRAVEAALPGTGDFLDRFRDYGWYLDDLVLSPINHLTPSARKAAWYGSCGSLAARIAEYQPLAIVSLLSGIKDIVSDAARKAGSKVSLHSVPFPGMGNQTKFHNEMIKIVPELPRHDRPT
jgi:hypothetical protein